MISNMGKSGRGRSPKNQRKNSWMQWSKPRSMEGHPFKYPHSNSQSWMSLLYGCKELLLLISWMGKERGLESDSLMNLLLKVWLWSLCGPHGEASQKDGDWGNDISCSRADQYGRKLRFKDFSRLKRVVLISQALAPEWKQDPSKGKLILNLNLYLFKVVLYSYMGEIVLLPFIGSLMHQWSQLNIQFFFRSWSALT